MNSQILVLLSRIMLVCIFLGTICLYIFLGLGRIMFFFLSFFKGVSQVLRGLRSKIFTFKVFDFISWTLRNSQLLDVRNVILSVCGGVDKQ